MSLTLEQMTERDERRRRNLERCAPGWRFFEWVNGDWRECDVHCWAWAKLCAKVSISLAKSGHSVQDAPVAMRRRRLPPTIVVLCEPTDAMKAALNQALKGALDINH